MSKDSLWQKTRACLAVGAAITIIGASAIAPASAVDTSGTVASQAIIQTVNDTTDLQLSAESIVMNTVFSNDGGVTATIKYKVSNDNAESVKQIVEPKNGVGEMDTSTEGDSTVYTVTIKGDSPQDFQQKFVQSDSTPNGYMPGARFEFMIGEGFGLWPQYAFLLEAPFTSNWFKDGVTGEYASTFDVPWLNGYDKDYKDSSTGQTYLQPSSAQIDGQKLTVSDPDGVSSADAKPSEHIQFVAAGPLRTQLIVFAAILLVILLLLIGLVLLLRKRRKNAKKTQPETVHEAPRQDYSSSAPAYAYTPTADSQPVTRPNKIVPVVTPAGSFETQEAAENETVAFTTVTAPSTSNSGAQEIRTEPAAYAAPAETASESAVDSEITETSSTDDQTVESAFASSGISEADSASAEAEATDGEMRLVAAETEPGGDLEPSAAVSTTVVSATEPYYDYEAQEWKNTEGWVWDGNQWQKTEAPYYDYQAQQWANTDGWAWNGDEWVKKPEYDYAAQQWTGTDGWQWDGTDWRREPHYNHTEGAWKGTEGWAWDGKAWHRQ